MVNLEQLIDDAKCYKVVRDLRWPNQVICPHCGSTRIQKRGHHDRYSYRQRYQCQSCEQQFDDLSDTIFEGHHRPLRTWVLCLYLMGLNLSNEQIAAEVDLPVNEVQTIEFEIYDALPAWGYGHKSVNHAAGEFARDEDGDGFHDVHLNTLEGFWSLLRSWLRPHRGISQEKLPWYLGLFEFIHNVCRRGKALLHSLLAMLVAP